MIIFVLSTLIAAWSEHDSGKTFDKDFFLKQENSFRSYAVLDLMSVSASQTCPNQWQPFLKFVSTQGTSSFCICQNANSAYSLNEVLSFKESTREVSNSAPNAGSDSTRRTCDDGCMKLDATFPVMLPKIHSRFLCSKLLNISYDNFELSADGTCPEDMKVCGKDTRDFLCLKKELPCPINRLKVLPKIRTDLNRQELEKEFGDKYYKMVEFSDTHNIYFSSEFTEEVVFTQEMQASHGAPCADPSQHSLAASEHEKLSRFWRGNNVENCHERSFSKFKVDSRYSQIFSVEKTEYLNQNNVLSYLVDHSIKKLTKGLANDSTEFFHLLRENSTSVQFVRKYLENALTGSIGIWHKGFTNFRNHCRENGSSLGTFHGLHVNQGFDYQRVKQQVLGANTVAWVTILYCLFLLTWVFCCKSKKKDARNQRKRVIFGTVLLILSVSGLAFVGVTVFYVHSRYRRLNWLCQQNCSDEFTTEVFCFGSHINWLFLVLFLVIVILHVLSVFVYVYWLLGVKVKKIRHSKSAKYKTAISMISGDKTQTENGVQADKFSKQASNSRVSIDQLALIQANASGNQDNWANSSPKFKLGKATSHNPYLNEHGEMKRVPIEADMDSLELVKTTLPREPDQEEEIKDKIYKSTVKIDELNPPTISNHHLGNEEDEELSEKKFKLKNIKNEMGKLRLLKSKTRKSMATVDDLGVKSLRNDYIETEILDDLSRKSCFQIRSQKSGFLPREFHEKVDRREVLSLKSSRLACRRAEKRKILVEDRVRSSTISHNGFGYQGYDALDKRFSGKNIQISYRKKKMMEQFHKLRSRSKNVTFSATTLDQKSKYSKSGITSVHARTKQHRKGTRSRNRSQNSRLGSHIELESYLSQGTSKVGGFGGRPKSTVTIDDIEVIRTVGDTNKYIDTSLIQETKERPSEHRIPLYEADKGVIRKRKKAKKKKKNSVLKNQTYTRSMTKSSLDMNLFGVSSIQRSKSQHVQKYQLSPHKSKSIRKKKGILKNKINVAKNNFSFKKPKRGQSVTKKRT